MSGVQFPPQPPPSKKERSQGLTGVSTIDIRFAIKLNMVKRLLVAVLLMLAVFSTVIHLPAQCLPAQNCAMAMAGQSMSSCADCCATMKTCVRAHKDKMPPATATAAQPESIALIAPAIQTVRMWTPLPSGTTKRPMPETLRESSSRLAVLCTFLI